MSGALPPAPIPPPGTRTPTKASKLAWLPTAGAVIGVAAGAATGGLGWLVGGLVAAASVGGGAMLFRRHKRERAELDAKAFEEKALAVYRNHRGKTMTKEQVVRDHRLHPDEAEKVLNWLVSHDLLDADWENYDQPMVYRRQGNASDATGKTALPAPRQQGQPRPGLPQPVVHHHHHLPPPAHLVPEVRNPTLAGLLSFFWPGVGQMYSGDIGRGLAFMFGTMLAWGTFVAGPFVHIWNVIDANRSAKNANLRAAGYDPRLPHLPPGALPPPRPGYPPRPGPPGPPGPPGSGGFGGSGY